MKEAAVLLYIVTLMSCALYIATSSFIVNNNDHNSNSSNYNNFNKRNIINGRFSPKFINFKNTVDLIVKAATCHPLLKPCRNGGKCIRDSNDRIYECRLDNDNNTDGNNNNNNNEIITDATIINNNTNSSKDSNSSSSSSSRSNDPLEASTIDHNNTSDSKVSITDNNISHGNNSNESIINNSSNESNKNSSGSSSSSSSSSKNDDNNKSNITRIINDSSNNSSNTDSNFITGNFNHNFITFNNTVDLIVKAATCHPLLKPCRNGGKCIRGSNERIYKCRLDNNNNTNDDDDDDNKNNNNNNGTFESPVVSSKNCTLNSTECDSGETCVKYNGTLQCRTLSVREQYICDLCTNGLCVFQKGGDISCSCKLQWTGDLCSEPCYRNCTIGKCILSQYEEYCECPGNFMPSSNCTEQYNDGPDRSQKRSFPTDIILTATSVTMVVLISLVIFLMWKRRFRFFMKFAYYFQPYIDKEEKLYDVFISYKSSDSDESWVKDILFPKIEDDMGLKACVHFRDFVPGETISNNIIESIQNSRRTILVLTNDYIESEWTRMEYQVAQQEMLKLRHRIIPIILGNFKDIDIKDKNLKFILETVTYLQWPSNSEDAQLQAAFWNHLKKTLRNKYQPKKVSA